MRRLSYLRTEFHADEEKVENGLLTFVYDVPYFGACGIFPPFHIANQVFLSGGKDGGMGPGAIWEPFQLAEKEYCELAEAVATIPPEQFEEHARYCDLQFDFDSEFDSIQDWSEWVAAVGEKHRGRYHERLARRGSST